MVSVGRSGRTAAGIPIRSAAGPARGANRSAPAALLTAAVLIRTAACTDPDGSTDGTAEEAEPQVEAAEAFAAALSSGDLSDAPLSEESREEVQGDIDQALEPLSDIPREVVVSWVSTPYDQGEGEGADAALRWTWDVPGEADEEFTYPVSVPLSHNGDENWQVEWNRELLGSDLGEEGVFEVAFTDADRGDILGADDQVLVTARDVFRIGIDKTFIDSDQWEDDALALAEELELADPQAYADRVLSAGERAFLEAVVAPQEEPEDLDFEELRSIEGVNFVPDHRFQGPTDTFATPILGRVGEVTAEMIEESDGELAAGDIVGLSGLNRDYEQMLSGSPGATISVATGEESTEVYSTEPVSGTDLELTLDPDLQIEAESLLDSVEPASALVAIDASTGHVLAAASGPGSEGWSTATLGQYAPGSTFKMVTALALMRAGIGPEEELQCTEDVTVDGRTFSNYSGYPSSAIGDITLTETIANSCNTALIGEHETISAADLAEAAGSLGLLPVPETGPGAGYERYVGQVPEDAAGTTHAAGLIGQGEVLTAPITMATIAASIAGGSTVVPELVLNAAEDAAEDDDAGAGDADADESAEDDSAEDDSRDQQQDVQPETPLTNEEAAQLRQMMRSAVTDGNADMLADIPGEPVGAKTGTAEHGTEDVTRAWMIAYQDVLAIAVFVEDGEHGAGTAGPLAAELLEEINS